MAADEPPPPERPELPEPPAPPGDFAPSAPPDPRYRDVVAPAWHTITLLTFLAVFTWLSASSIPEEGLPPGMSRALLYVPTLAFQWVMFAFVWWGLRRGGVSVRGLLANRWQGFGGFARTVLLALAAWAVIFLVVAQAVDWLGLHDPDRARAVAAMLLPREPLEYGVWMLLAATAGFVEEVVFRGYLQRQFTAWTGNHPAGIVLSALVFGAGHLYQGLASAGTIAVIGLCFGALAYATRSLMPGVYAHAWADIYPAFFGRI
jgi:membrane protease YdiL (CAAX protease family)